MLTITNPEFVRALADLPGGLLPMYKADAGRMTLIVKSMREVAVTAHVHLGHWSKLAGYLLAAAAHSRRDGVPAAMRPGLLVPNTRHAGIAVYRVASTNLVTLY